MNPSVVAEMERRKREYMDQYVSPQVPFSMPIPAERAGFEDPTKSEELINLSKFIGSNPISDFLGGGLGSWAGKVGRGEMVTPTDRVFASLDMPFSGGKAVAAMAKPIDALAMPLMTAWHGSPHKWDKIDLSKVGTGEGAQAYGHGFYAAENPDTAKYYRDAISTETPDLEVMGLMNGIELDKRMSKDIMMQAGDHAKTPLEAAKYAQYANIGLRDQPKEAIAKIIEEYRGDLASKSNLYKLDIPDEAVDKMLDWDKPLSEQPESVRESLKVAGIEPPDLSGRYQIQDQGIGAKIAIIDKQTGRYLPVEFNTVEQAQKQIDAFQSNALEQFERDNTGVGIYQSLVDDHGQKGASEMLNSMGIPGIRYLDATSRRAGEGTRNFVLFDENTAKVLERNGEKLAPPTPAPGHLAEQMANRRANVVRGEDPPYIQPPATPTGLGLQAGGDPREYQAILRQLEGADELPTPNYLMRQAGEEMNELPLPMDEMSRMQRAGEMGFGGDLYHASKQDINEFVPGYEDGLTFLTDNPNMANSWLGKGKYNRRIGADKEIEAAEDAYSQSRRESFDWEALNKMEAGPEFNKVFDDASAKFRETNPVTPDDLYSAVYPVRSNVKNTFDPQKDYKVIENFLKNQPGMDEVIQKGTHKRGNWLVYENKAVVDELKRLGYDSMRITENIGGPHETLAVFDPKNIRSKFATFDPSKKDSANILAGAAGAGLGLGYLSQSPDRYDRRN